MSIDTFIKTQTRAIRVGSVVVAMGLLSGLFLGAQQVIHQWRTPEALWSYTLHHTEGKGRAYVLGVLGSYYQNHERYPEALLANQAAHEIYPEQYIYPMIVGSLLVSPFRRTDESSQWFEKILDASPAPANVLFEYGKSEYLAGRGAWAESFLSKAAERNEQQGFRLNPKEIYFYLGLARLTKNNAEGAFAALTKASHSSQ